MLSSTDGLFGVAWQVRGVKLGSKHGWLYVSRISYTKAIALSTAAKEFLAYVFIYLYTYHIYPTPPLG